MRKTFVGGIIAFRTLPRPQFSTLQASIFPVYFGLQTVLPAVMALTYPGERSFVSTGPSSLAGVFAEGHRATTLLPILTVFLGGLTNALFLRPATARVMQQRKHQGGWYWTFSRMHSLNSLTVATETIDGKKSYDPAPHSKEMMRLNKAFGKLHGISSVVNLVSLVATVYYGKVLADRLQ